MIDQAMYMFEQFIQISKRNHLDFFAGCCALVLILAITIVYVWNKVNQLAEKKKQRSDISLGPAKND